VNAVLRPPYFSNMPLLPSLPQTVFFYEPFPSFGGRSSWPSGWVYDKFPDLFPPPPIGFSSSFPQTFAAVSISLILREMACVFSAKASCFRDLSMDSIQPLVDGPAGFFFSFSLKPLPFFCFFGSPLLLVFPKVGPFLTLVRFAVPFFQ